MAEGDVANVILPGDADVAIADVGATLPTDPAAYGASWDYLGLLDGSAGMPEDQSNDKTELSAWGRGVIRSSRKNVAITRAVTVLEENATTLGLRYDANISTTTGVTSGTLDSRDPNKKFLVGFDYIDGDELVRLITSNYAQIESIGTVTPSEDGPPSFQVTFAIYPTSGKVYWRYYRGPAA